MENPEALIYIYIHTYTHTLACMHINKEILYALIRKVRRIYCKMKKAKCRAVYRVCYPLYKNREEKYILVLIVSAHKKLIKAGYLSRQRRRVTRTGASLFNLYLVILVGFENHVNIAPMPNKISTLPPITITTIIIIVFKRLAKKAWVRGRFATHRVRIPGAE